MDISSIPTSIYYWMLYGAVFMLCTLSSLYLWLRPRNIFSDVESPRDLRQCTSAFIASMALSHVWWLVLEKADFIGDILSRAIVGILLDAVTLVPLAMVVLMRMLQNRRRSVRLIWLSVVPMVFICLGMGLIARDLGFFDALIYYLVVLAIAFVAYMFYAVRQYGLWLRDNYADLAHKEVWQVQFMLLLILLMFVLYRMSTKTLLTEFAIQFFVIVLVAFLLRRVENLQQLEEVVDPAEAGSSDSSRIKDEGPRRPASGTVAEPADDMFGKFAVFGDDGTSQEITLPTNIGQLLEVQCVTPQLYLQYDLTLARLCAAVGTNRTYLSAYFRQNGITYNTYINKLRIEHFMHLCHEAISSGQPFFAQEAALQSGFQSYRTFTETFKKLTGMTARKWIDREKM